MRRAAVIPPMDPIPPIGQRGPVDHERRAQILQAADHHFRLYGYAKTSVADLAKAIGVSSAYVYRFFESKQAIGEAICAETLGRFDAELRDIAADKKSAASRLRAVFHAMTRQGLELFVDEHKLYELVLVSVQNDWASVQRYKATRLEVIQQIVVAGRKSGEFERKTPMDETCSAISEVTWFSHPLLLALRSAEELTATARLLSSLVLRSLAP